MPDKHKYKLRANNSKSEDAEMSAAESSTNMAQKKGSKKPNAAKAAEKGIESYYSVLSDNSVTEETAEPPHAAEDDFQRFVREALSNILSGQKSLEDRINRAIEFESSRITELEKRVTPMEKRAEEMENKVTTLNQQLEEIKADINKTERFSRRNNLRIVGVAYADGENCIDIAETIFRDKFDLNPGVERAHRDGRAVDGKPKHILVKILSYRDKVEVMKNARQALKDAPFFVTEDLTRTDRMEKKRWSQEVKELYGKGTKLRFTAGKWRANGGAPYKFPE